MSHASIGVKRPNTMEYNSKRNVAPSFTAPDVLLSARNMTGPVAWRARGQRRRIKEAHTNEKMPRSNETKWGSHPKAMFSPRASLLIGPVQKVFYKLKGPTGPGLTYIKSQTPRPPRPHWSMGLDRFLEILGSSGNSERKRQRGSSRIPDAEETCQCL